jgi:hypothetical protein
MTEYTKKDLELIRSWITMKLDSMPKCTTPLEQYSETNLSRAILKFIQHLMDQEQQKIDNQSYYAADPYIRSYNLAPQQPAYGISVSNNTSPTICDVCKQKSPTSTHCVHKVVMPLKY